MKWQHSGKCNNKTKKTELERTLEQTYLLCKSLRKSVKGRHFRKYKKEVKNTWDKLINIKDTQDSTYK